MVIPIETILFYDTETRSAATPPFDDVTEVGSAAYFAHGAKVILFPYAIGDGPVQLVENWDGVKFEELPKEVRDHYNLSMTRKGVFAAFNSAFDRRAWSSGIEKAPWMIARQAVDVMAQAMASNLPPALEGASKALGREGKHPEGKRLIKLFCGSEAKGSPTTHPEDWALFKQYAIEDVEEMRHVYKGTRPLPLEEWEEFWASEYVNDAGMAIDMEFVKRCAAIAEMNIYRSNAKLDKMTGGVIDKVTQTARITDWVWDRLKGHSPAREFMEKAIREDPNSPEDYIVVKKGLSRDRIENILTYFNDVEEKNDGLTEAEILLCELLEIRQWDGSSAPAKFAKMLIQQERGSLHNSYVFNGAAQTGRFSSRGVQVHNLTNKFVGLEDKNSDLEIEAIEMINSLEI
jgi:DNA polymerase bacteriophage-type